MFCPKCGTQNNDDALFCASCGEKLKVPAPGPNPNPNPNPKPPVQGEGVGALGILLFCIPLAGIVLFFVWQSEQPKKSKQACILALAGAVTLTIFYFILAVSLYGL